LFAIVLAVVLGILFTDTANGGPLTTYIFIGYALGLLFAGMYIAVNLAAIGFYLGERRDEFNPIKHIVAPVIGVILLIPAFLSVLGGLTIPILDIEVAPLASPFDIVPPLVGIWMLIGIGLGIWLWTSRRAALARVGDAMTEV
jgi:hypothetical protein